MGRAMVIAFFILAINFSMSLLFEINGCYMYGGDPLHPYVFSDGTTKYISTCPDEPGVGHEFIPYTIPSLLFNYSFTNAEGIKINPNDPQSYNSTMQGVIAYKPNPIGITDIFGFFSWVITAGRFLVNALFMPLFGFPQLLTQFWVPTFMTYSIGSILMLIQIIGLYEFFSGRDVI